MTQLRNRGIVVGWVNYGTSRRAFKLYPVDVDYDNIPDAWFWDINDDDKNDIHRVWAVMDGAPVPIPEPSTLLLLGSASALGAAFRKRSRKFS